MSHKTRFKISIFILFFILVATDCTALSSGPMVQVQTSVEEILTILKDETLKAESRREEKRQLIIDKIDKRFNFRLMAQLSLGSTVWNSLTDSQKDDFSTLFTGLLKNTYINRVEGYSDEKVEYLKEAVKDDLAVVYSSFEKNNSQLNVIYKMRREEDEQWFVYDVVIEGASIIKQYRRQFAEIISKEQFSGLISRLEEKLKAIDKS